MKSLPFWMMMIMMMAVELVAAAAAAGQAKDRNTRVDKKKKEDRLVAVVMVMSLGRDLVFDRDSSREKERVLVFAWLRQWQRPRPDPSCILVRHKTGLQLPHRLAVVASLVRVS